MQASIEGPELGHYQDDIEQPTPVTLRFSYDFSQHNQQIMPAPQLSAARLDLSGGGHPGAGNGDGWAGDLYCRLCVLPGDLCAGARAGRQCPAGYPEPPRPQDSGAAGQPPGTQRGLVASVVSDHAGVELHAGAQRGDVTPLHARHADRLISFWIILLPVSSTE